MKGAIDAGTCTGILKGSCSAREKRGNTFIFLTAAATPPSPGRIFCLYHLKLSLTAAATPTSPGRIFCLYVLKLSLTAAATPPSPGRIFCLYVLKLSLTAAVTPSPPDAYSAYMSSKHYLSH